MLFPVASDARTILGGCLGSPNECTYTPVETMIFQGFYDKWESDLLPTYRESTRHFYQSTARRWIRPNLTDWRIADIRLAESAMHSHGISLNAQQTMLSHSNPNITFVYAESYATAKDQAVKELGKFAFPNCNFSCNLNG